MQKKKKGKRKNRKRGKNDEKIKEESPPLSTDPRRASQMSPKSPPERSTDPEKQSVSGKICIICHGSPYLDLQIYGDDYDELWDMDYCLFLLDFDAQWESSSDDVPVIPNMYFSGFRLELWGFCALGSTLYLFGRNKSDVFSYELSSIPSVPSSPPLELTPDMLSAAPPDMNFCKYHPIGCPTPDGKKMIVFSSVFSLNKKSNGNFESFDGEAWTELPDLHPVLRGSRYYDPTVYVTSYSFIDDEPVLLITTKVGNFTLNVEQPESGWSRWKDFKLPEDSYGSPMLVRGRWRLMDWFEWVDGTDPKLSYHWETHGYYKRGGGITWLLPLNRFCVLRSQVEKKTMRPHLNIDVCDFDDEVSGPKLKERIEFAVGLRVPRSCSFDHALLHFMRNEAV